LSPDPVPNNLFIPDPERLFIPDSGSYIKKKRDTKNETYKEIKESADNAKK
jgi:hypothetical protein